MKKIILAIAICLSFYSCKKEQPLDLANYNYSDSPQFLNCQNVDTKLITEAYYAFENAVLVKSQNANKRPNKIITKEMALRSFMLRAQRDLPVNDFITEETAAIFKIIKEQNIWDGSNLNYSSELISCVVDEIKNEDIKLTFLALKSTNSITSKLMASTIYGNTASRQIYQDNALMTYSAFEMYYSKMFSLDFTTIRYLVKKETKLQASDSNNNVLNTQSQGEESTKFDLSKAEKHGPNDGHNH